MRRLKHLIPCLLLVLAAPLNAQDEKSEAMIDAPSEVAENADAVREVNEAANIPFTRVVEAMDLTPQ